MAPVTISMSQMGRLRLRMADGLSRVSAQSPVAEFMFFAASSVPLSLYFKIVYKNRCRFLCTILKSLVNFAKGEPGSKFKPGQCPTECMSVWACHKPHGSAVWFSSSFLLPNLRWCLTEKRFNLREKGARCGRTAGPLTVCTSAFLLCEQRNDPLGAVTMRQVRPLLADCDEQGRASGQPSLSPSSPAEVSPQSRTSWVLSEVSGRLALSLCSSLLSPECSMWPSPSLTPVAAGFTPTPYTQARERAGSRFYRMGTGSKVHFAPLHC